MISRFFVDHPVFANVIAIVTVLLGVVALRALPIEQFPQITPPTVQVRASYPGANAQVVADTVAAPIEQQVNGVERMLYMQSTSSGDGSYTLTVTFQIGTDLDTASVLVQNRVSAAEPLLPEEVRRQGVTVKKQSTDIVLLVSLTSPKGTYDSVFLANYATLRLRDELSRVSGVGDARVLGGSDYSMRVWLDPERMRTRGLTTQDVVDALREQNLQVAAGQIGAPPAPPGQALQYAVTAAGRLSEPGQFERVVVKVGERGRVTYLGDVAEVELGSQSYDSFARRNGQESASLLVYQLPGANALDVAHGLRETMERLATQFPPDLAYEIPFDTTLFVAQGVNEVYRTLFEAGLLVLLVILVFLQSFRAVLVPATTVPVTIVGAFAFLWVLGFTVNFLTLFGLVLAIGIVVDDAIVIVENASHHIERGLPPREATIQAMSEVTGPIIAITLVLMAVFLPASLLGGVTGQLYRQFALTIAATALISAINALTLKPAQCARWLKSRREPGAPLSAVDPPKTTRAAPGSERALAAKPALAVDAHGTEPVAGEAGALDEDRSAARDAAERRPPGVRPGRRLLHLPVALFNSGYARLERRYTSIVGALVRRPWPVFVLFFALLAVTAFWYRALPTAFLPVEDQGFAIVSVQLPDAASLERTRAVVDRIDGILREDPAVDNWNVLGGLSLLDGTNVPNAATMFVILKPWSERTDEASTLDAVLGRMRSNFGAIEEAVVFPFVPPAIRGLGFAGGFQLQVEDRGGVGREELGGAVATLLEAAAARPELGPSTSTYRAGVPQLRVIVDREKVASLDLSLDDVYATLQAFLGSTYVNDFNRFGRTWQVRVQAAGTFRDDIEDVRRLEVRSRADKMIPLGTVLSIERSFGPQTILRYNLYPTASISGSAAPGTSSGEALAVVEELAASVLPPTIGIDWTGVAFQERLAGNTTTIAFGLAVLLVYLVLAAQYESWLLPLAVILVVPLGLLGSTAGAWLGKTANNVYTQVGVILIIALASKNAILIVEFARELAEQGRSAAEAAVEAARMRFRPILMTSFAFLLGVLPLVLASGAGAASRRSLGVAVFGGMITGTVLAVFFVPVFFLVIELASERMRRRSRRTAPSDPHAAPIGEGTPADAGGRPSG